MATIRLPRDFSEFLKLLDSNEVNYLLVGGHAISGVTFNECYPRREAVEIDGNPAPVISLEHLKRNKRASGRAKDLADLDELA